MCRPTIVEDTIHVSNFTSLSHIPVGYISISNLTIIFEVFVSCLRENQLITNYEQFSVYIKRQFVIQFGEIKTLRSI